MLLIFILIAKLFANKIDTVLASVGWVERSATHQFITSMMMGYVALHPSYGTKSPKDGDISRWLTCPKANAEKEKK